MMFPHLLQQINQQDFSEIIKISQSGKWKNKLYGLMLTQRNI